MQLEFSIPWKFSLRNAHFLLSILPRKFPAILYQFLSVVQVLVANQEYYTFVQAVIPKRGLRFNATSCLIYTSVGEGILYSIELDISFKPEKSSGIMIYASQHKNGSGSYLLVQLKDGRFEFSFATGLSNVITVRWVDTKLWLDHVVTFNLHCYPGLHQLSHWMSGTLLP